jgi:hypothetical protein
MIESGDVLQLQNQKDNFGIQALVWKFQESTFIRTQVEKWPKQKLTI